MGIRVLVLVLVLGGMAVGAAVASPSPSAGCPVGVIGGGRGSATASTLVVLRAAQRLLARKTLESQGTLYHLTPTNAPIDYVANLSAGGVPGTQALARFAARTCGQRTATESWAIHYPIPVSVIAVAAGYRFIVLTRGGWRFWGYWCGLGRSTRWKTTYCVVPND